MQPRDPSPGGGIGLTDGISGRHCLCKAGTVKADQALARHWRAGWCQLARRINTAASGAYWWPGYLPLAASICDRLTRPLAVWIPVGDGAFGNPKPLYPARKLASICPPPPYSPRRAKTFVPGLIAACRASLPHNIRSCVCPLYPAGKWASHACCPVHTELRIEWAFSVFRRQIEF